MATAKQWGLAIAIVAAAIVAIGAWRGRATAPATGLPVAVAPVSETARAEQFARSPDVQAGIAVGEFASFYFLNTRARPSYCAAMKVDLAPFVRAFSDANAAEWAKAQALMRRANVDPETVWQQSQPTLDRIVMRGLGNGPGTTAADACLAMNATPDAAAAELVYSKVNPVLHRALMAAK